jgi:hypothetical protein
VDKLVVDGEAVVEAAAEGMVVADVVDMAAVDGAVAAVDAAADAVGPRLRLIRQRCMGAAVDKATVDGEAVVEAAVEGMVVAAVLDMAAVDGAVAAVDAAADAVGPRLRLMRLPTRWMGQR